MTLTDLIIIRKQFPGAVIHAYLTYLKYTYLLQLSKLHSFLLCFYCNIALILSNVSDSRSEFSLSDLILGRHFFR